MRLSVEPELRSWVRSQRERVVIYAKGALEIRRVARNLDWVAWRMFAPGVFEPVCQGRTIRSVLNQLKELYPDGLILRKDTETTER
jgi:hypothetical protein